MKDTEDVVAKNDDNGTKLKLDVAIPAEKNIICDVCGHSNAPGTSICVMCSNYLFLQGGKK